MRLRRGTEKPGHGEPGTIGRIVRWKNCGTAKSDADINPARRRRVAVSRSRYAGRFREPTAAQRTRNRTPHAATGVAATARSGTAAR